MKNSVNVKISSIRKKHSWIIDGFIQGETYFEFIKYCQDRNIPFDNKLKSRLLDAITPCEDCIKLTKAKSSKPYIKDFDRNQWKYKIEQSIDKRDVHTNNDDDNVDFYGEIFYVNY